MNILFDGYYLDQSGIGLGVFSLRLLRGLLAHDQGLVNRIRVAVPPGASIGELPIDSRLITFELPTPRRGDLLRGLFFQEALTFYAKHRASDHILIHPAGCCAGSPPAKTLLVFHDCIYHHFSRYRGTKFIRAWLQDRGERYASRCSCVVTESEYSAGEIINIMRVPRKRVHVVRAWLPPEYNRDAAQQNTARVCNKYKLPERFWLYVGGYDYRKNIEFMLRAYATVRKSGACSPLVLAGRIPADLRQPICDVFGTTRDCGLDERSIVMPGFIAAEDMPALYGAASLFIYPSLYEGFGLPPMEALGCGCTTIVADATSLPEVVRDRSHRFSLENEDELIALMQKSAKNDLPFNPSFTLDDFSETVAMSAYWDLIIKVSNL